MKTKLKNRKVLRARALRRMHMRAAHTAGTARGAGSQVFVNQDTAPIIEVYDSELRHMFLDMGRHPDIETGWFGLGDVTEDGIPRLLLVAGPGPKSNHQPAFFQQDTQYMDEIQHRFSFLQMRHLMVGHSHHKMNLPRPSGKDVDTMFSTLEEMKIASMVLVIGTIEGSSMCLYPYMFKNDGTYCRMQWRRIAGTSPVRKMMEKWEMQ